MTTRPTSSAARSLRLAGVALGLAAVLALTACGDDQAATDPTDATDRTDAGSTPGTAPLDDDPTDLSGLESEDGSSDTPTPLDQPRLIVYSASEAGSVYLESGDDADLLKGAPDSFKTFIADAADQLVAESICDDGGAVGITVDVVRTDGFAGGEINDCGGAPVLWAEVDGAWVLVGGSQDVWECSVLEDFEIPSDVLRAPLCTDADGDVRDYTQA